MVNVESTQVASLMIGEVGIKTACIGDELIYTRSGGYFYLELSTEEDANA